MSEETRVELDPAELELAMELAVANSVKVRETEQAILSGLTNSTESHSLARKLKQAFQDAAETRA